MPRQGLSSRAIEDIDVSRTPWLFRMRWVDLLFMHRPVPADTLRPLITAGLELDTYDGRAWLGAGQRSS